MTKYFLYGVIGLLSATLTSNAVLAGEIQYGHVEDVHGAEIFIQYKGPVGIQNFVCGVDVECESFGTSTPNIFPEIEGKGDYDNSPDGNYGIVETEVISETGSTTYVHTLYDISGDEAKKITVIPYDVKKEKYKFPWASDKVVIFATDGEVVTYDIAKQTVTTVTPTQSELPLRSLSPHAKYVSAYNYVDEAHKIWNTKTGDEISISSKKPSYVEFSQNEKYAAYLDNESGYQTLYIADMAQGDNSVTGQRVFKDDFVVEDYLFFKDDLYAVANTKSNPYAWSLYKYDVEKERSEIVAENVSYGDYIRPIGEYALSFLTIDGKNSHVSLYYPETDSIKTISPVTQSPASADIKRSVIKFADTYGVLYEPKNPDAKPELFVWLHGGPERQTSFGYHSYLSYAVYDELLERLVESGAYVLKLDFAGSYGYSNKFMDDLNDNIGKIDVKHVIDATRQIQRQYRIDDTYLIGNSYGGYLGPKVLVEDRKNFNGAIAINGVFDWFTLLERIPSSPFKTYFNGLANLEDLDQNFELYEQASIVKDLPKLKKQDLLLIYGENDSTVPTWQTREFFYLAETQNKNVDLLKLEGEDHIIKQRENLDLMCNFIGKELLIKDLECGE